MHGARTAGHGSLEAALGSLDQGGVRTRRHGDGTLLSKLPSNSAGAAPVWDAEEARSK